MAHKKWAGSSKNGIDSNTFSLGIKILGNSKIFAGNIIARQYGLVFKPGENVGYGKDYTLFALKTGYIKFISINKNIKRITFI